MRILYGVQATGNGHITRARVMAPALRNAGIEVDYLFSGRPADQFFNMEPFGDYQTREGLTFVQKDGRVKLLDTALKNNPLRAWQDAGNLDLSPYDRVLTDFEPVTAWAAKRQKVPSLGIAHQYALVYPMPGHNHHVLSRLINLFAPVDTAIGVHWHHYNQPVLPQLIQPPLYPASLEAGKILVYLPANSQHQLCDLFAPFPDQTFHIYCGIEAPQTQGHLKFLPFSRDGFQRDLASCSGVVTNCGFGLISEALQSGKKVFSMPLKGQLEQQSNAQVLSDLGLATIAQTFDQQIFGDWLQQPMPAPRHTPDVAGELASWIANGCQESASELARRLWEPAEASVIA